MLVSFVIALLLVAPEEPKKDDKKFKPSAEAKKELKALEGKWRVVKMADSCGEGDANDFDLFFTFQGSGVTLTAKGKNREERVEIADLDPGTDPKCIDLIENADTPGKKPRTLEGVYTIDGDTLRLAFATDKGGKIRPANFDKPTDARIVVWTLKRVKE